ncbi:IS110 family transposase [Kordia sp.]|uniref:IS110 family transposase n=1 Tax=Kordia sp. TaxID=1965332 RepID=UPI003D2C3624
MKIKEIVGIDVSKLTIDVCIHFNQLNECFENNSKGFARMLIWIKKNITLVQKQTLFVFEHTGIYSHQLADFLEKENLLFSIVPGLEIKRSLGITRGKSDQVDAKRIALYGYRLRDELKPSTNTCLKIKKLHALLTLRSRLVKQRAGFKSSMNEQKSILNKKDFGVLFKIQQELIDNLTAQIIIIEEQMEIIVKQDLELTSIFDLVTSISGIGPQAAYMIIVYTNNFKKFKTWRKFASYSGIAPFPYQSGTSIRKQTRVSHLANKEIKVILNMCAMSAIRFNPEMKKYYQKRVKEGKNKMSTLNIIRNKLVARVFAIVERGTPYVNTLKYTS